jgi:hypothetical protein
VLFLCAWHFRRCRSIVSQASLFDWLWVLAYIMRHPQRMRFVLGLLRARRAEEDFLFYHTRCREAERKSAILRKTPGTKALVSDPQPT